MVVGRSNLRFGREVSKTKKVPVLLSLATSRKTSCRMFLFFRKCSFFMLEFLRRNSCAPYYIMIFQLWLSIQKKIAVQAGTGDILPETTLLVTMFLGVALSPYGPLYCL